MHRKVKITVLRTEYYQELAEQYAIPNLGICPFHQKGQVLASIRRMGCAALLGSGWLHLSTNCLRVNFFSPLALG